MSNMTYIKAEVARLIYEARKMAGLTQTELAELIGSKQPVIARLEDADREDQKGLVPKNRYGKRQRNC